MENQKESFKTALGPYARGKDGESRRIFQNRTSTREYGLVRFDKSDRTE
jgi:hypothetical protein